MTLDRLLCLLTACGGFWCLGVLTVQFAQQHTISLTVRPVSVWDIVIVAAMSGWLAWRGVGK